MGSINHSLDVTQVISAHISPARTCRLAISRCKAWRQSPGWCWNVLSAAVCLVTAGALLPSPLHGHQCELPGDPNPQFAGTQGPCEPLRLSPSTACLPLPGAPTGTLTVLPQGSLDQGHSLLICSRASPFCPHRAAPADLIPPALGQSRPC